MNGIGLALFVVFFAGSIMVHGGRPAAVPTSAVGNAAAGKVVLLDHYYNNEWKKNGEGKLVPHHYTWDDTTDGGFSLLGNVFAQEGFERRTLMEAPTAQNLAGADLYMIVDPDTEKETPHPHYLQPAQARVITDWVKKGGVLLLMGNDSANAGLKPLNLLAEKFGIHFNEDRYNGVVNDQYEQGLIQIPENHFLFKTARNLFIKDLATLKLSKPAVSLVQKEGRDLMAIARWGRGTVFAVGDPWLYNEYTNGRLPPLFHNVEAAKDLVTWLAQQCRQANKKTDF